MLAAHGGGACEGEKGGGGTVTIPQIEIQLIAVVVSSACALSGVFLVLRKMALMSDAISHSILLGIVLAFFVSRDISSPFLVIAAALTGVLTVVLVELVNRTGLVREDAAIGLVFPVLFSVGVILISRYAGSVHLDTDAVLLGELAFAPFNRLELFGYDVGPKSFYVMAVILVINILFVTLFYKELKLSTFDAGLAISLGLSSSVIHYALMSIVSITAVGAFDAVGSILVVALMIAPPVSAYLLSERLNVMIVLSVVYGMASALGGYWAAHFFDTSIAGAMATCAGVLFFATFLFAPYRGMVALVNRRIQQRWEFASVMLTVHLLNHENSPEARVENNIAHLHEHLRWENRFAEKTVRKSVRGGLIILQNNFLILTDAGREVAEHALVM